MKCVACGYEHLTPRENITIESGNPEFMETQETYSLLYNGGIYDGYKMYACPKCGTLKIKIGI